ncbi:MAG TPA: helix-turn-helix transcriptional regulator [Thermomicrobiales bacterium]|nr:helix-turn-helix transcriptional regulator [Thermomicrobiales bacterium]
MAIEQTLLGLLAREPRHGYELTKEFMPETTLGDIVHLESGMLYAHLKKLQKEGWVTSQLEAQESRPPRRVFSITDAGRAELQRWLGEPVSKTRDIRLDFLLKLYTAQEHNPHLAEKLIGDQRAVCERLIESLREQMAAEEDDFRRLVLEMRLAQNAALLSWLRRAAGRLIPG